MEELSCDLWSRVESSCDGGVELSRVVMVELN